MFDDKFLTIRYMPIRKESVTKIKKNHKILQSLNDKPETTAADNKRPENALLIKVI